MQYMTNAGLRRVVLIEDFVGSGSQMAEIAPLLTALAPAIRILITPLVTCPGGVDIGNQLANAFPNVEFAPVLPVPASAFIAPVPDADEPALFAEIRRIIQDSYLLVSGGPLPDDHVIPYGPFGFASTGGLVVMYGNCPDNTLPAVHHSSNTWEPLFPRSARLQA